MTGSYPFTSVIVFSLRKHRFWFYLLPIAAIWSHIPEDAFDLSEQLVVGEVSAGNDAAGTGRHTGATPLTQRRDHLRHFRVGVEFDRVVGTQGVADAAAGAELRRIMLPAPAPSSPYRDGSTLPTRAAAAAPCTTVSGTSFGPWQAPAIKMPSVMVATGSSLGWRSTKKPSKSQPILKICETSLESWRDSIAGLRITMSTGTRRLLPRSVS